MLMNIILSYIKIRYLLIHIPRIACILFIILQILGMSVYPGGTIHDNSTIGYSFSKNFFSDMGAYAARNEEPNYLSMIIFSSSLTIVGITFALYYLFLPRVLGIDKINNIEVPTKKMMYLDNNPVEKSKPNRLLRFSWPKGARNYNSEKNISRIEPLNVVRFKSMI